MENCAISRTSIPQKPTICLAIICKNEEHCILKALESAYKYIDYWVICDTGSTDNTVSLIKNFFKEKQINVEIFSASFGKEIDHTPSESYFNNDLLGVNGNILLIIFVSIFR